MLTNVMMAIEIHLMDVAQLALLKQAGVAQEARQLQKTLALTTEEMVKL